MGKSKTGWIWDDDRIRVLVDGIKRGLTNEKLATLLSDCFPERITESAVAAAMRNKGIPARILELFPKEGQELLSAHGNRGAKSWATRKAAVQSPQEEAKAELKALPAARRQFRCTWPVEDDKGQERECGVKTWHPFCRSHTVLGRHWMAQQLMELRKAS
ncbi:MAG: hypothetical protein JWL82_492 [Parcubacteria group bacterium]|nr:hypothetical protein [Parcubacteria group bacterium]